jgi:hypothetical protein
MISFSYFKIILKSKFTFIEIYSSYFHGNVVDYRQNPGKHQNKVKKRRKKTFPPLSSSLRSDILDHQIYFTEMEKYEDLLTDSKRTINKWEHEFQKTNGRKPSKVL